MEPTIPSSSKLHYTITGRGPAIVFLPGMGLDLHIFDTITLLLQSRYTCIQLDNWGSGNSPAPKGSYTIDFMADKVAETLRELNLSDLVLVGHSMGGFLAMTLAAKIIFPISKLILISTSPTGKLKSLGREENVAHVLKNRTGTPLEQIYRNLRISVGKTYYEEKSEEFELFVQDRLHHIGPGRGFAGQQAAARKFDARPFIQHITCPSLIIHGTGDQLISSNCAVKLFELLPVSNLEIFNDIGHMPMIEVPKRTADAIDQFVKSKDHPLY